MFGGEDAVDDGEEANAGIEITLLDTQLRPYVFFSTQGELMGHVWSGTGSERTTALQVSSGPGITVKPYGQSTLEGIQRVSWNKSGS